MKICVVNPNENWILDRIADEWRTAASEYSTKNLNFSLRDEYVDKYHVPCKKTKDFISQYTTKPIVEICYWYNPELWYPMNKDLCREELGLSNKDFIVGSFQRDTEGKDLKSPKLEKGPDLFIEYLKMMDIDNLHVLLGGWRRQYVINRLKDLNIKYTFFELAPLEIIRKMYASCDLYVVSSRHEGGPQALLEASAMRVPIVSTNVGIAESIMSENCIIDIKNEIYFPNDEDVDECHNKVKKYNIQKHIDKYVEFFRGLK